MERLVIYSSERALRSADAAREAEAESLEQEVNALKRQLKTQLKIADESQLKMANLQAEIDTLRQRIESGGPSADSSIQIGQDDESE